MRYVMGVSWPRSGHHMLVRLLSLYFGPAFRYCEFHVGHPTHPDIDHCCRTAPCHHRDRIHFTKNHDFDLTLPQNPNQPYIIQYRDFAHSVVSEFETAVRAGGIDDLGAFRHHVSRQVGSYRGFINKWVTSDFACGQLVLRYEAVLANPQEMLKRVLRLFEPNTEPDLAKIAHAVANVDGQKIERKEARRLVRSGVHAERNLQEFRYYDPALFDQIDRLHLSRKDVQNTFATYLGQPPKEEEMLEWQSYETVEHLAQHLVNERKAKKRTFPFFPSRPKDNS